MIRDRSGRTESVGVRDPSPSDTYAREMDNGSEYDALDNYGTYISPIF